jgi:cyclopropane fatty-acyl-phospholipid synthase-like methyltransferase
MTYSFAVWERTDATLEQAQAAKYELVCRKLGLEPGMLLLDIGCGLSGMVLNAAANRVELEPLRAGVREQVHAAAAVLRGQPPRELGAEISS